MKHIIGETFSEPSISHVSKEHRTYEDCQFKGIVFSDILLKDIKFVRCTFDHLIIEASFVENVLIKECEIKSLRIRGNREITRGKIFSRKKAGYLRNVNLLYNNQISELVLCGNLIIENCQFPSDWNHVHIYNPALVYEESLKFIEKNWNGEKRRIGLIEVQNFYLAKDIGNQNEDFITYVKNENLDEAVNEIIYDVFELIKELSQTISKPNN